MMIMLEGLFPRRKPSSSQLSVNCMNASSRINHLSENRREISDRSSRGSMEPVGLLGLPIQTASTPLQAFDRTSVLRDENPLFSVSGSQATSAPESTDA